MKNLEALDKYRTLEVVGAGANGLVYKALNKQIGDVVAIKQVQKESASCKRAERAKLVQNEKRFLEEIEHPNIIGFKGFFEKEDYLAIILEFMEGGSICQIIEKLGPFEEGLAKIIIRQVLKGLNHLHKRGIVHRDIKVSNHLGSQYLT